MPQQFPGAQSDQPSSVEHKHFSIVGIGASAGGLEAFEQFFRSMPTDSGLAFVLVSHLDPSHASLLTEILQRTTTMPVMEAQDHLRVAPNSVYVIPPNRDMAIFGSTLLLSIPEGPRGQRMPIDAFLRTLAEDQGEKAVGVILSGTGTDGTQGLRAILGAGGITLAQDPQTAKYAGMPSSAIQAGYVTRVLQVEEMPTVLQAGMSVLVISPETDASATKAALGGMNRILMLLRNVTGNDFSQYKKNTIGRRIERRMSRHNIEDVEVYVRYLKENPDEVSILFKELLINVTNFFRDPEAFLFLKEDVIPQILADKPEGYVFRAWVSGCATGEEAYSIAILLREFMDESQRDLKVQIYATDLDEDAINVARAGLYSPNIAADVLPERLRRFFVKEDAGYRIKKEIREMVVFAIQNIIKDPPFTRLDLLTCRNLMIYLEPELQNRLIPAFHYAIKPGGVLFLSPSESIGGHPNLFAALSRKWKIYRAVHSTASARAVMASGLSWAAEPGKKGVDEVVKKTKEINFSELTKRVLLQFFAPASVLVDLDGNILFVHGETGKYLRPAPGQATLNLVDMAREGLQLELRSSLQEAASLGNPILNRQVLIKTNGDRQMINLNVRPLPVGNTEQSLLLVSFQEMAQGTGKVTSVKSGKRAPLKAEARRIDVLEHELAYTRENLQATIEEQQASNEELKSTNEELQSTNEELQSTNEELETSKEELQSVNEELVTVNSELQAKIEQLAGMQNDMKNLLDNINIGTIFLDQYLCIRRFTREATQVYRLVSTDVGRSLADIKSDLEGYDLLPEAQAVLDTLVPFECEAHTVNGTCYLARIQPYRTLDNMIDGVVLTFTDISLRVAAEAATQVAREQADAIIDTLRESLLVLDDNLNVVRASRSFLQDFQVTPEKTIGCKVYELGNGQWDIPELRELLENILPRDKEFEAFEVVHDFPTIGRRKMILNARRILGEKTSKSLILLAMEQMKE
ncbi:MAG: SAM-dependent methyltransferase [Sedimenticola thiotaurini]|uniref:protein-glutamate O-methyltransferase n=1 Tax=Sedimenticola thiotaurini TaxID=1543721 RepID=A0A558D5R0_9GAMM|nr:MAG: SAM-dependent methyltransferase [Sedimenticola thiotaurini]